MIAMVATFRVAAENADAFERVIGELAASVRANEPTTRLYQLCRSKTDATVYRLLELYESQADMDAHMKTDWIKIAGPKLAPLLMERPLLEPFDTVG